MTPLVATVAPLMPTQVSFNSEMNKERAKDPPILNDNNYNNNGIASWHAKRARADDDAIALDQNDFDVSPRWS